MLLIFIFFAYFGIYSKFVEWSMANQKRKYSAIKIQRCIKGFLVRRKIQNLKSRVSLEQRCCNKGKAPLFPIDTHFIADYD